MLENSLFFLLGFLLAVLVALLIAPAIWRRAVALTRKRIESTVPISMTEIQAEKDQLRAGFAIQTRKLEVSLEQTNEKANAQLIELNRKRDVILEREDELTQRDLRIAELDLQIANLSDGLETRTNELNETAQQLKRTQERLLEKGEAHTDLLKRHAELIDDFDGQKIEIAARETRVESVKDEHREVAARLKDRSAQLNKALSEIRAGEAALERERTRSRELDGKVHELRTERADLQTKLERRESDLARLRNRPDAPHENDEIQKLREENDALRAEANDMSRRLEIMFDNSAEGAESTQLRGRIAELQELTVQLTQEHDDLQDEPTTPQPTLNGTARTGSGHEVVRQRIAELAAQFTAMTAAREGVGSPVSKALAQKTAPKLPGTGRAPKTQSLSDRIRAAQEHSENV